MSAAEYAQLVEYLGRQFTVIDQRFGVIDQRFVAIDQRFTAIDQRFATIEQSIADLRHEILGHFDELYRRLERLEQEYYAIGQALRRIETLLADESRRREVLQADVDDLRLRLVALQGRIEALEQRLRE